MSYTHKYKKVLSYIENYWPKVTFQAKDDDERFIGLPHEFVAPNETKFSQSQYYWDSFFTILGLVVSDKENLARGMINNFSYLINRFGMAPTRNRFYDTDRSQLPFFTSMILEIYEKWQNNEWLFEMANSAERELFEYWKNKTHLIEEGLSCYAGSAIRNDVEAEYESGWDLTSRFKNHCLDYLPVDLNSCLYKYEKDLKFIYEVLGNKERSQSYNKQAELRKEKINQLCWNNEKNFFFDYNYKEKSLSNFYSMAGFYPLWAKIVNEQQAKKCVEALSIFEYNGGLVNSQKEGLLEPYRQWDWPNGWSGQQWIAFEGLLNYGYKEDAKRIALKWLDLNAKVFEETGKMWEKYDVVNMTVGKDGRYPTQSGFGWTNGVFARLVYELEKL